MNICVVGAGYVGLVTSACFAYFGNKVVAIDNNRAKIKQLESGAIPFFEPGLAELVKIGQQSGHLSFSDNLEEAVKDSEIIFIAVGTPSQPSGEPDLSQVMAVARSIGAALDDRLFRVIVNKSTVPVGSGNWVEMLVHQGQQAVASVPARGARNEQSRYTVVSNPEFLREGSALHDSFYPDRIVVGSNDPDVVSKMRNLYEPLLKQDFEPPKFMPRPEGFPSVPFVVTDLASAEMIKYSANAFLAMKISFANEIANLCEKVGADIRQVAYGIGLDQRIGSKFLNAGIGWGGSCFGKDVRALVQVAREYNSSTALLESTISVNDAQRNLPITKLQEVLKIIKGRTIGVLGLSFKPNTDDLRDAPSITIISQLLKMGAQVKAYDPVSMKACFSQYPELDINYCESIDDVVHGTDALVLVTEWNDFREADWKKLASDMKQPIIIDGRNCLDKTTIEAAGFVYRGIGQ